MNATATSTTASPSRVERVTKGVYATPAYNHLLRQARRTKATMTDVIDERLHAARRAARKRALEAQDAVDGVGILLRRRPFRSVGVAFAAGAAIGALAAGAVLRLVDDS
jgi:ElaB/YqjD/DUF883 family membrane-anchored ribosome-binding protein